MWHDIVAKRSIMFSVAVFTKEFCDDGSKKEETGATVKDNSIICDTVKYNASWNLLHAMFRDVF